MVENCLGTGKNKIIKTGEILKTFQEVAKEYGEVNDELSANYRRFETVLDNAKHSDMLKLKDELDRIGTE